ncbi:hypothetical protein EYF80_057114 [Liparis tanakae]|uniref:Uncharacterized protein n=1 Tax=Liparis tanakae TaxID=230148 RepID=A0A4Z2EVY8_9TELE|nr:hypothetical protein EYF80_057114 [Liparis tanakae]
MSREHDGAEQPLDERYFTRGAAAGVTRGALKAQRAARPDAAVETSASSPLVSTEWNTGSETSPPAEEEQLQVRREAGGGWRRRAEAGGGGRRRRRLAEAGGGGRRLAEAGGG